MEPTERNAGKPAIDWAVWTRRYKETRPDGGTADVAQWVERCMTLGVAESGALWEELGRRLHAAAQFQREARDARVWCNARFGGGGCALCVASEKVTAARVDRLTRLERRAWRRHNRRSRLLYAVTGKLLLLAGTLTQASHGVTGRAPR